MRSFHRSCLSCFAVVVLGSTLTGCGSRQQESVTIAYAPPSQAASWYRGESARQRILDAFAGYSDRHGYRCRPHPKRVQEKICTGRSGMHVTLKPGDNRPVYVTTFTCFASDGSTDIVGREVAAFMEEMQAAVSDVSIARGAPSWPG